MESVSAEQSVTLIGMPGSGKTTVGRALARVLNSEFLDMDVVMEEEEGMRLSEIIAAHGQEVFLDIECKHILALPPGRRVISPGGSVVYREDAMRHLASLGPVAYLNCTLDELHRRLGDLTARGVVMAEGQNLDTLYAERLPLYEQFADLTLNTDGTSIDKLVSKLMAQLGAARANP